VQSKQKHLALAELIDSYRIFPRLFLLSCFIWTVAVGQQLLNWYTALPSPERGIEATGFASVVFLGILGFLKLVYSTYSAAGRNWPDQGATTQSTATVTTSTTAPAPAA
jgi:hypothetical protein